MTRADLIGIVAFVFCCVACGVSGYLRGLARW